MFSKWILLTNYKVRCQKSLEFMLNYFHDIYRLEKCGKTERFIYSGKTEKMVIYFYQENSMSYDKKIKISKNVFEKGRKRKIFLNLCYE